LKKFKRISAFTLTELLVVLVIIGILALIALPDQTAVISKAKAQEAKLQLEHLYSLQKQYFYMNSKYSASLEEIDFEQVKLSTEGGNANYKIEIVESGPTGFKARATAIVDFDQDGSMNVWEIDQEKGLKEVTKD
jgi:type IV pilus assembly protein PilE